MHAHIQIYLQKKINMLPSNYQRNIAPNMSAVGKLFLISQHDIHYLFKTPPMQRNSEHRGLVLRRYHLNAAMNIYIQETVQGKVC